MPEWVNGRFMTRFVFPMKRRKADGFERATGGMNYVDLPRMAYYVDKATFRGKVTGWIERLRTDAEA